MNNEIGYKNNNYEMLKCIWMTSGVIEYKLCDNKFDCENCPFDKVIRNLSNEKETELNGIVSIVNNIFNKLQNLRYDNSIIYLKNNLIVKEICPNTFYLGINPVFASFLDSVRSISLYENGKNIFAGQQIVEICGDWGNVILSAPINFLIYNKVGNPTNYFPKSQWFAIVGFVHQEITNCKLYQNDWDKMHQEAINIIEDIKLHIPEVGTTMLDGGTQIKYLHQLVGKKKYLDILNSLNI